MIETQLNKIISILETKAIENTKISRTRGLFEQVNTFLMSNDFRTRLKESLNQNDYSTQRVLNLFYPLIEEVVGEGLDNFETYLHQYAVAIVFPNAAEIEHHPKMDLACEILLPFYSVFCDLEKEHDHSKWVSKYPLDLLGQEEIDKLEDPTEYNIFVDAYKNEFIYELMKITQDIVGYTTLDHVSGVHYLAVKIARQIRHVGLPIDLGRVSGAAAGHDIGKFGCKGEEKKRVAYYHYHYSGEWFNKHDIVYIRNVAINHSTWDLELENLSLESLVLIYCDFRVKANDKREMTYYSLEDSFKVILDKLDNVDAAKERRYRKVYAKLKDFDAFLKQLKINVDPQSNHDIEISFAPRRKYYALMQGNEIIENAKFASIDHNIKLMYSLRDESSLNKMLESARDVKDQSAVRGYIQILEEYSTYLTQKQKLITLKFLYERLVIPEEDLRNECARLIGAIIGNFDEERRKEIPKGATIETPMISGLQLFNNYLGELLNPDHKIIERHRRWISYTAGTMVESYFENLKDEDKREESIDVVLSYFDHIPDFEYDLYLMDMIRSMPMNEFSMNEQLLVRKYLFEKINSNNYLIRLTAADAAYEILGSIESNIIREDIIHEHFMDLMTQDLSTVENYSIYKILKKINSHQDMTNFFRQRAEVTEEKISGIFLSNLKSATAPIVKKLQIEMLLEYTATHSYQNAFYTALHFSNLLKVSALSFVRNAAGEGLIKIVDHLSSEQKNDIVIELLRSLEMESYQFTRYIPLFLGRLILKLPTIEFDEIVEELEIRIRKSNPQIALLVVKTVGVSVSFYSQYQENFEPHEEGYQMRLRRLIGIVFCGFVNYEPRVNQTAFRVFGKYIFSSKELGLDEKKLIFDMSCKKILELMSNIDENKELVFFNNCAGLMHMYRFIGHYNFVSDEPLHFEPSKKIAFFPGSFDPFTLSHKQIAKEIRNLGFEVYLSIDEFSWSKRTQPNLVRRDIVKMSVADEIGIYSFPRDLAVNIANPKDMKKLKRYFNNTPVHIVVGSDVIQNASAYKGTPKDHSVATFPHVVFVRCDEGETSSECGIPEMENLHEESILLTLPVQYEQISSTRIRDYIDENRDISDLIDPLVQRYIYEKGLYQREPQFKQVMTTKSFNIEIVDNVSLNLIEELAHIIQGDFSTIYPKLKELFTVKRSRALVLRSATEDKTVLGFSIFHWVRSSEIFSAFEDVAVTDYIRDNSVGRIIHLDGIYVHKNNVTSQVKQQVLTETLAFCLARDYTYAVYTETLFGRLSEEKRKILNLQGFIPIEETDMDIYCVNMTAPCTLSLDCKSMFKAPFRNNERVVAAIKLSRDKLQEALIKLYPGNLILCFDRTMIYEHLIKKICDENNMPTTPIQPKTTGDLMCVPFGAIFRRWLLPNTVTKSMHLEKYFEPDLMSHEIRAYPYYLDVQNQVKILKSYNRPIILVDDLLNKGYRIEALDPVFNKQNLDIRKVFVGILSGRGKAIMERQGREVDSAYFIPRLKVWFNESNLYPFIGGDALWRGEFPERNLIPSINLILPYSSMAYIKGVERDSIYELSKVCLENTIEILSALEEEYQQYHERMLTIGHLGEVLVQPRFPDKGNALKFDMSMRPTEYLANDLEQLKRMEQILVDKKKKCEA